MQTKIVYTTGLLMLLAACASPPKSEMTSSRGPASATESGEVMGKPEGEHMDERENLAYDVDREQMIHSAHSGQPCNADASVDKLMAATINVFHSHHKGMKAIRDAYANCTGAEKLQRLGGAAGYSAMSHAGWKCEHSSDPYASPNGAWVFEGNKVEVHYKVGNRECFVSDFQNARCLPLSETHHGKYSSYGWCHP
jgi:hypothetical protein